MKKYLLDETDLDSVGGKFLMKAPLRDEKIFLVKIDMVSYKISKLWKLNLVIETVG